MLREPRPLVLTVLGQTLAPLLYKWGTRRGAVRPDTAVSWKEGGTPAGPSFPHLGFLFG